MGIVAGCGLPDFESQDPNALDQTEFESIIAALKPELDKISTDQLIMDHMVEYKATYRVEIDTKVNRLEDIKRRVKKVNWSEDPAYVVMEETHRVYEDNKVKTERTYDAEPWYFKNPSALFTSELYAAYSDDEDEEEDDEEEAFTGTKYYNLKVRRKLITPPEKVYNRPNCGGVLGCTIEAIEVNYIAHQYIKDKLVRRTENTTTVSHEVPPLFVNDAKGGLLPIVQDCARYLFEGIYVKQCLSLEDLDKNPGTQ